MYQSSSTRSYATVMYQNGLGPNQSQHPNFSVAQTISNLSSTANNLASSSTVPGSSSATFRPPAHKHAHHLHSIPPREKSTRTLIIDHMIWVHGRTRFAQARAELGMTDRTGGPSSLNYTYRERPENFEEDEEVASDGEDAFILHAREGRSEHMHNNNEDGRISSQDLILARNLRLRAEGLEKVVTSMLDQPPLVHPHFDSDPPTPPASPKRQPILLQHNHQNPVHPHTLPNGVRVRLTLATIINDLFARQAPPPPYRHHHQPVPIVVSSNSSDLDSRNSSPVMSKNTIVPVSQIPPLETLPSSALPALPPAVVPLSAISTWSESHSAAMSSPRDYQSSGFPTSPKLTSPASRFNHNPTSRALVEAVYAAGINATTGTRQSVSRCPRHLHPGCEICVEAKSGGKIPRSTNRARTGSLSMGWMGGMGAGPAESNARGIQGVNGRGMAGSGNGVTGWQDGTGIGSGLARPDVDGCVLRRKSWSTTGEPGSNGTTCTGAGNTKLSELIPRFLRLSALVAVELGNEARDEEIGDKGNGVLDGPAPSSTAALSPSRLTFGGAREQNKLYSYALRPSRQWYMLLVGLLTRAALEGYLTGGWRGTDAIDCLFTVGLGPADPPGNQKDGPGSANYNDDDDDDNSEVGSEFEWFDPDGLPRLQEAARILFPALRPGAYQRREGAEAEFEREMNERMRRFYAISLNTPDLSTHMEDLARHYPVEPVERIAVRYCEAVAKWRGKPELETYKKKPRTTTMTMESLVHSNPTSPATSTRVPPKMTSFGGSNAFPLTSQQRRPSIEKYFEFPTTWNGNKRRRSTDEDRSGTVKRLHG